MRLFRNSPARNWTHTQAYEPVRYPDAIDMPAYSGQEDLSSAGLFDYWKILMKRKWSVLALTAFGLIVGFLWTIPSPFLFSAKTVIEVQAFNGNFMGMAQVDPQAENYAPTDVNIATQMHVLKGDALKSRVLNKLSRELAPTMVPEYPGMLARLRRKVQDALGRTPHDPLAAMRGALSTAASSLDLRPIKGTRLIEIVSQSTIPDVSAAFTNAIANEYMDQLLEQRMQGIQRTSQWFTTQLQETKEKLERSEARLHQLNPTGSGTGPQTQYDSLLAAKLTGLQQQLATVQADRISREAQYQMAASSPEPERVADTNGSLAPYQKHVEDARANLNALNATLTPEHYKVKKAQADLDEAEAALKRERGALLARLRAESDAMKSREKMLMNAYNSHSAGLSGSSGRALEYSLVQREVESNRQIYQMMLQQASQANVASAVQTNNIRVIEPATPSRRPSNAVQSTTTALGGATGLLIGFALAIVLHHLDRSVKGPGHATSLLNLPELGVIPSTRSRVTNPAASRNLASALGLSRQIGDQRVELATWEQSPSLLADSFRAILASILIPNRANGAVPQIIVTTSPNVKEGKSTITCNLGIALTELGRSVLLIDADLRRPRLHEVFGTSNDWGLTTLLAENRPVSEYTAEELSRQTKVSGVRLLPSGPTNAKINSLLYSERLRQLLERARGEFDTILIDSPPMIQFADARVLGKIADGVILVLRSGTTEQSAALAARERLAEDGSWIIGTILNDWTPSDRDAKHYREYHAYYSQRAD